jgi:hypothetical protein
MSGPVVGGRSRPLPQLGRRAEAVATVRADWPPKGPEPEKLKRGNAGRQQLLDRIASAVAHGAKDIRVRLLGRKIILGLPPYDKASQWQRLIDYVAHEIPYVSDPVDAQVIPEDLQTALAQEGLDCKGKTIALMLLAEGVGIETRPVTVDQHKDARPPQDHHIYAEALIDGVWVAGDPVLSNIRDDVKAGAELSYKRKTAWKTKKERVL